MKRNNIIKAAFYAVRILLTVIIPALCLYILYKYEYISQFGSIDNIVGVIPVAFAVLAAGGGVALVWLKYSKKTAPLAICMAVLVIFTAALFPAALRGSWWIAKPDKLSGSDGDISAYAPFTEGSLTAKLGEESELVLDSGLPVIDGALALYPVYSAVVEAVYEKSVYNGEAQFTNTVEAFNALIAGERDVIFTAAASQNQRDAAAKAGVELKHTPVGKEAFVFVAGKGNPVNSITHQQIRNIYSGKTAFWSTLGWREGGRIIAFQRPDGSGSQTGLQSIMKGLPVQSPQPLPSAGLIGSNSLMQQISAEWKGVQPALGYTYRFFGNTMYPNPGAKFLRIDGVEPSVENIKSGAYPFTVNFYAVTRGEPAGNTQKLINWILSPQGQRLIEKTGYVPL